MSQQFAIVGVSFDELIAEARKDPAAANLSQYALRTAFVTGSVAFTYLQDTTGNEGLRLAAIQIQWLADRTLTDEGLTTAEQRNAIYNICDGILSALALSARTKLVEKGVISPVGASTPDLASQES